MKKNLFVKVVLSSLVLLLAVGCGKQEDNKKDDAAQSNAEKQQVIRVGTSASYNPWAFQEDDKLKGFEIKMTQHRVMLKNSRLLELVHQHHIILGHSKKMISLRGLK